MPARGREAMRKAVCTLTGWSVAGDPKDFLRAAKSAFLLQLQVHSSALFIRTKELQLHRDVLDCSGKFAAATSGRARHCRVVGDATTGATRVPQRRSRHILYRRVGRASANSMDLETELACMMHMDGPLLILTVKLKPRSVVRSGLTLPKRNQ